jgi:hypothetical protein
MLEQFSSNDQAGVELAVEDTIKRTVNHLYSISADCSSELVSAIDMLRQLINEAYVHEGKMVGSQAIWDVLKPAIQAHITKRVAEARLEEVKRSLTRGYFIPEMEVYAEDRMTALKAQLTTNQEDQS